MDKTPTKAATASYSDQYKDPRWQKKRLEILERDNFTCQLCGDTQSTLHVHHTNYQKGKKVWESNGLITLCGDCHGYAHRITDDIKARLSDIICTYNASAETYLELVLSLLDVVPHLAAFDTPEEYVIGYVIEKAKEAMDASDAEIKASFTKGEG